jgi:hypothetical protein
MGRNQIMGLDHAALNELQWASEMEGPLRA